MSASEHAVHCFLRFESEPAFNADVVVGELTE